MPKRFWTVAYYVPSVEHVERPVETQLHRVRDGLAVLELSEPLQRRGYRYGGSFLAIPKSLRGSQVPASAPQVSPSDLVLHVGRPPLDDDKREARRGTSPWRDEGGREQSLHLALRSLFDWCDRKEVRLRANLAPALLSRSGRVLGAASRTGEETREISYFQSKGGRVKRFETRSAVQSGVGRERLSYGYLVGLRLPDEPWGGARLLAAWGMGGTETLVLAWLLRKHCDTLLDDALAADQPTLWMVPFLVPEHEPQPWLDWEDIDVFWSKDVPPEVVRWTISS